MEQQDLRSSRRAILHSGFAGALLGLLLVGTEARSAAPEGAPPQPFRPSPEQQAFLDQLQHDTFKFFWEGLKWVKSHAVHEEYDAKE